MLLLLFKLITLFLYFDIIIRKSVILFVRDKNENILESNLLESLKLVEDINAFFVPIQTNKSKYLQFLTTYLFPIFISIFVFYVYFYLF